MSTACRDFFKKLSMFSGVPLIVYEQEAGVMLRYSGGTYRTIPVPDVLECSLKEEDTVIGFFSKGGNKTIVYFLRTVIEGVKCACVIKDSWFGENINAFFQTWSAYCLSSGVAPDVQPAGIAPSDDEDLDDVSEGSGDMHGAAEGRGAELQEAKQKLESVSQELAKANDRMKIMQAGYDSARMLAEIVEAPLYYISPDFTIFYANKAALSFANVDDMDSLIGRRCHDAFFGSSERCAWCKLEQVITTGESFLCSVEAETAVGVKTLDVRFFPITDPVGGVTGCGGMIFDKADTAETESSTAKMSEQLASLKKAKLADMREIHEMKEAYRVLSQDYSELVSRSEEMAITIEMLKADVSTEKIPVSSDDARELAEARREISKQKRAMSNLQGKYDDLRSRAFFQMDRLIGVLSSPRYYASNSEVKDAIRVLKTGLEELKKSGITGEGGDVGGKSF